MKISHAKRKGSSSSPIIFQGRTVKLRGCNHVIQHSYTNNCFPDRKSCCEEKSGDHQLRLTKHLNFLHHVVFLGSTPLPRNSLCRESQAKPTHLPWWVVPTAKGWGSSKVLLPISEPATICFVFVALAAFFGNLFTTRGFSPKISIKSYTPVWVWGETTP